MNYFPLITPVDQSLYREIPYHSISKIKTSLVNAKKAQQSWQLTDLNEKILILEKAVQYFLDNQQEIAQEITWQMGRPIKHAVFEINGVKERAHYMMQVAKQSLQDIIIEDTPSTRRKICVSPLGVVFVIAPWNYPYLTVINAVIPALLAGNAVILKHSEQTPLCADRFQAAFQAANLPEDTFQALHIPHLDCEKILEEGLVDGLAFTGSKKTGCHLQNVISQQCLKTNFELGGHDSAYVRSDAPIKVCAENLVDGAFFNAGQSCCGIRRIYIHEKQYTDFVEAFIEETKQLKLGNPTEPNTTLGPVVSVAAADVINNKVKQATLQGAELVYGLENDYHPYPNYLSPKVLCQVNHSMSIMQEEVFGPVVMLQMVKDDCEAIKHINDCQYGLTASIWTQDLDIGETIATQTQVGTCFVNRCDYLDPALPWTGQKFSGTGLSLSHLGFRNFTRTKAYNIRSIS